MAGAVKADPNKGSLKLEHDLTPRDVRHIHMVGLSSKYDLGDSHRFRGFPDSNFTDARVPLLGSPKPIVSVSHKKPQHFVKGLPLEYKHELTHEPNSDDAAGRPNVIAKDGVQYGSEEHSIKIATNLPVSPKKKTPFWNEDRTSAEDRKKARQQREADWDQAQWKKAKDHQVKATVEEKKKDLQMLREYKPFGRTGGGAPRAEQEAYRTKAVENSQLNLGPEILMFPQFGKPGHGAPIRSDSGNLKTSIRSNNDIRFRDGVGMRRGVENKTRYTMSKDMGDKLNSELGVMALEKRTQKEVERHMEKEEERQTWKYNPFGKSGAGAPIKTDSGNVATGRARTLAKDPLELKQIEDKPYMKKLLPEQGKGKDYNPWGKGQGAPEYDSEGNTKRLQWSDPITASEVFSSTKVGVGLETKSHGGGGHVIDEKGEKRTRFQQTLQQSYNPGGSFRGPPRNTEQLIHEDGKGPTRDPSEPWGKPGGGAPVYLPDGRVNATNRGKATIDKMGVGPPKPEELKAKQEYLSSLKAEIEHTKAQRKHEVREVMRPGEETVNWIRSKEVGYPPKDPATGSHLPIHHKGTSDITRHMMDIRRPGLDARDYRTELVRQAEQRQHQKVTEKTESRQAVNQHYTTFDDKWGKPGNGAPYEPAMKRHSLDLDKFHQMRRAPQPVGSSKQPYARTKALEARFRDPTAQPTVPLQQPMVRAPDPVVKSAYQVRAPWAAATL